MLLLPPALNLKGIDDATFAAVRQKCCASKCGTSRNGSTSTHFWRPALRLDSD
jgi:hypothetical protein